MFTLIVHKLYYIQSPRRAGRKEETSDTDGGIFVGLGEYERTIVGKLIKPAQKILCIVGPLGSGKTTSVQYLLHKLNSRPCQACPVNGTCTGRRLNLYVDLNKGDFQSNSERLAKQILYERLCLEMRAKLKVNQIVTRQEELSLFWDEEIPRANTDPASTAFKTIITKLDERLLFRKSPEPTDEELRQRGRVLEWLGRHHELYLDYLVRLWGYAIRHHFQNQYGCAFVVFDNIDKASPTFQFALQSIVMTCANDPGPAFLLVLRPQTHYRLGMNTAILDVEMHRGPRPSEVVMNRLERFAANPDSYFDPETGLKLEEFQIVRSFLLKAYKLIKQDDHHQSRYLQFLDSACGQSVRISLVMAQNLLRVAETDMSDPKISSLVRVSVNQGADQLRISPKSIVANLFHVQGEEDGRLLVKSRILRFISASPEQTRSLNEIRQALMPFQYSTTGLIRKALNELMNVYCQLAFSDGFDSFSEREFQYAGTQQVRLTEAGGGYVKHLLYDLDYIQEVMLDTYVLPERFGLRISTFYLAEKFLLLAKFLKQLLEDDGKEMLRFTQNSTRDQYFQTFGSLLISLEVICRVSDSVQRIIQSIRRSGTPAQSRSGQLDPYDEVLDQFNSLVLEAERDNHRILGIWHNHDRSGEELLTVNVD